MKNIEDKALLAKIVAGKPFHDIAGFDFNEVSTLFYFDKGESILTYNKPSDYLYFLVKGKVAIVSQTSSCNDQSVGTFMDFAVLGEAGALWNSMPTATVKAWSSCLTVAVDLRLYRDRLLNDVKFLRYIAKILAAKIIAIPYSNASNPVEIRLAAYLASVNGNELNQSLVEISQIINASYRHLMRIMKEFTEQELLRKDGKHYYILNRTALNRIAQGEAVYR